MVVEREEGFWTFEAVQERLVEAMRLWWRMPDRERGWHAIRAYWPEMRRHNHFGDYADTEAVPRPLPLTRAQIGEMEQASEWLLWIEERDRRLVVLALAKLAAGRKQVPWGELLGPLGMNLGKRGLAWRYSQAITLIANVLNAAAGLPHVANGERSRYPKAVLARVAQLKAAENLAEIVSSPRMKS